MISMKQLLSVILLLMTIGAFAQNSKQPKLWYNQPAQKWEPEALPIGNGRMGAMLYGGIKRERIQFNEQSLWSGDNNWDGPFETGDHGFGCYRNFGEITIDFNLPDKANLYKRTLNITTGVHTTQFEINGVKYTREAFASYLDQVIVFRYTANKKAAFTGKVAMTSAQGASCTANTKELSIAGEMPNRLKYAAKLQLLNEGGVTHLEDSSLH